MSAFLKNMTQYNHSTTVKQAFTNVSIRGTEGVNKPSKIRNCCHVVKLETAVSSSELLQLL